jgi:hypothetical protein
VTRRRFAAVMTAVLAASVLAPVPAPVPAGATPAPVWGDCPPPRPGVDNDPRMRCTTVRVPLDHRAPRGEKLDIVVSRISTAKA